ncbi:MAG: DNA polymerase III subunit beta [SAR324 cluster bacterium]|nr:DNA polymerase III subunit beta [SAR324 cluster bacterium]MCZ6557265.1 DNA polymerase III subunit beta [SAR324 cluster bacterium]MCZ6627888.1 DNA polymerase III subunit beta [SAR324 cluster bacterium]MCZ6644860.1 DNA polymerase III subunit beta [SAR324 cluster bacterium]MCZ6842658.1 DNA polymerase III subunit beta [SAR324 cluster bacterium]
MKITINKDILVDALQIITPITDKSSSKPILSNFLLTVEEGAQHEAHFAATDYEIAIQGAFPAQVSAAGSVCISAKMVLEVCREFLSEEIQIESDDQLWVTLSGGAAQLRLPSVEVGLYPQMETAELTYKFKMPGKELKKCIDLTLFAAQTSEARKNLMGVCLSFPEGGLSRWTATDGHRLAQVESTVQPVALDAAPEIIIPRKSLVEMQKVLEKCETDVEMAFDDRSLKLTTESIVLTSRLIEGKFPNVDQVIPKDNDKELMINRERMINALKITSLMSNEKIKPVKLSLEANSMKVESEKAENGESYNQLDIEYQGESMQIGFNARYLLDVLAVASHGENVKLELKGALNPCLIRVPDDASFLSVVMPLRIEW